MMLPSPPADRSRIRMLNRLPMPSLICLLSAISHDPECEVGRVECLGEIERYDFREVVDDVGVAGLPAIKNALKVFRHADRQQSIDAAFTDAGAEISELECVDVDGPVVANFRRPELP